MLCSEKATTITKRAEPGLSSACKLEFLGGGSTEIKPIQDSFLKVFYLTQPHIFIIWSFFINVYMLFTM